MKRLKETLFSLGERIEDAYEDLYLYCEELSDKIYEKIHKKPARVVICILADPNAQKDVDGLSR